MIEKVTNNSSKVELMSYGAYGFSSHNKNQERKKNQDQFDEFTKNEHQANPFDDEQDKKDNRIQEYFNQRFAKINTDIKDVISRISGNSTYNQIIDNAIIESQALIARYLYNKTLPKEEGRIYKFQDCNNYSSILVFDINDRLLLSVDFERNILLKIRVCFEKYYFEIYLRKEGFLSRILGNSKTQILKYEKRDFNNNLLEEIFYSNNGQIEKYLSYQDSKVQSEICFDLSVAQFRPEYKNKLIPLSYSLYDIKNEHKLENLVYTYCLPNKYQQYNHTTGKIIKSFVLQGLKSKVVRYAFFNSLNGQMTACGNL